MSSAEALRFLRARVAASRQAIIALPGGGTDVERLLDIVRGIDALFLRIRRSKAVERNISVEDRLSVRAANLTLGMFQQPMTCVPPGSTATETQERLRWADSTLALMGTLGRVEYILSLVQSRLAKIQQIGKSEFRILVDVSRAGVESIEKRDVEVTIEQHRLSDAEIEQIGGDAERQLSECVDSIDAARRLGVLLHCDELGLERKFFELGQAYCSTKLGYDTFEMSASLGGVQYGTYLRVLGALIGFSSQHLAFGAYLGGVPGLNQRWVLTPVELKSDLISRISQAADIPSGEVAAVLDCIALTPGGRDLHCSVVDAAGPPLISLPEGHLVFSHAGVHAAPIEFLLRELRHRFLDDWNRARQSRESGWRSELYALLPKSAPKRFITARTGQVIRYNGKFVTDIDALVYDRRTGKLGLFQFKWMDLIARDMRKRASHQSNFLEETEKWVENTSKWLSQNTEPEIFSRLGMSHREAARLKVIHLFVIGRYYSHFSNQEKPDERAVWGSWGQVLRLRATATEDGEYYEDPIGWLARHLEQDSPRDKIQQSRNIGAEEISLFGTRVLVHAYVRA